MKTINLSKYGVVLTQAKMVAVKEEVQHSLMSDEHVVLDFSGVKGIDSTAARELITSLRERQGGKVQFTNAEPMVKSVLIFSGGSGEPARTSAASSHATHRRSFSAAFSHIFATLLLLLTLCVGQMWAANEYNKRYLYVNSSNCSWWTDASSQPALNAYFNTNCKDNWAAFQEEASGALTSTSWYFDLSGMHSSYLYFRGFKIERHPKNTGDYWNTVTAGAENNGTHNCLWINSDGGGMSWGDYAVPISSITLSATSGYLSGSGTSGSPYLVPVGTSISLSASPSCTPADGTMSFCANFGTSPSSSPTTVTSTGSYSVTSTSKVEVKCIGRNNYGEVYSSDVTSNSIHVQGVEPSVGVSAAGSVTTTSATFNATVTVNGATTTAYGFKYGTTNNVETLKSGTDASTSGALAANATSFNKSVTGLSPSTTYYYISYVTTASGTYYSASTQSFTTATPAEETHDVAVSYKYGATVIKTATTENAVGVSTTRSVTAPTITGYTFSSWTLGDGLTNHSANTSTNPISITTKASGSYTLQANYNINSYTVTFNANSGSGSMSNESFNYNQTKALTTNTYTRAGYVFKGWATSSANATAGTVAYADGANYTMGSANVTLYAVWYKKAYFVNVPKWSAANIKAHVYKDATSWKTWNDAAEVMTSTGTTVFGYTIYSYEFPEQFTTVKFHNNGDNETDAWTWAAATPYYYHGAGTQYASVAAIREAWKVYGSWNKDGSGNWVSNNFASYGATTATYTVSLAASTSYSFKYVFSGTNTWYGSTGGTMSDGDTWTLDGSNDVTFTSTVAGTYTFTIDYSGMSSNSAPSCTVDFPVSYTLTYSIGSVAGTSGTISTSPSTSSGSKVLSGSTVTLTAPDAKTGYTWKGWYTNAAGTSAQQCATKAYAVTMNANKTLYACYTENEYNVSVSAGSNGSVSPTGTVAVKQITGTSLTATPSTGYHFVDWTISGGGITPTTSSTSPQTFKATTTGGTIQANFAETTHTVNVVSGNSALGSVSTASVSGIGIATASGNITATPVTGATFSNWTLPSGVTAAGGYSDSSNPIHINATADSKTITANFTETMHSVTLTNDNSTYGTVNTASPVSVGRITAVQIQATAKTNYMFSGWVKTSGSGTVTYYTGAGTGQLVDETGASKATTYICVTGDVTLKATWEEDRSSGYVVHYGNDGYNADEGTDASQARDWLDGVLNKPSIAESNTSSFVFTASTADVDKVLYFKIHKLSGDEWYGNTGKITSTVSDWTFSTDTKDARLCITMPGNYTFTWDKSSNQLSVTYPSVYYLRGGFNSWGWSHPMTETSSGVYSATVDITEANHTYSGDNGFKLLIAGQYYGKNSTTVTRANSTGSAAISGCGTSGGNIGIITDYTGNYTFTYTVASNTLQVTYPTAYQVTYGKGSVDGSASDCSAVDITNGGTAVTSNSTWVKSGNQVVLTAPSAKSGYRYLGWYNNNSATGAAETTNANCTITVNSAAIARYACYAENLSSITVSAGTGGTVSTGSGTHSLGVTISQAIDATPSTGYSWSTWTISGNARLASSATTKSNTAKADGTNGGSGTITATFTPNHYDVILDVNGGSGDNQTVDATFDAAMPTTQKGGSTPIAARTKTGYNFDGYWANNTGTGTQYYTSALASNHVWDVATNETHIYAKWNPKTSALTLDEQSSAEGYGSPGTATASASATYDAAMPALSGSMPTAAEGYAFMGFYDATGGSGTKYYNADGTSAHNWDKNTESGTTLYAYYKKAEVATLTLSSAVVAPGSDITATATISPTPVGTTVVCWRVLYSNDNPLAEQPTFTPESGNSVTFTAPAASGTYKVEATLRTGSSCGSGTELSTRTVNFQVAGDHTVSILYKDASGNTLQPYTTVTGKPLEWTKITAPDIFGYDFTRWEAGDGITLSENGSTPLGSTTSGEQTIYFQAIYDGSLTAVYTQRNLIYFKNTLGWESVFVNFYTGSYWNTTNGSGNKAVAKRNIAMEQIEGTDIWFYDYQAASITPTLFVSFTSLSQDGVENFKAPSPGVNVVYPANYPDNINTDKSSENGFKAATPMFVPIAGQTAKIYTVSGEKANYYNSGYWTTYIPGTGYTLEIYNEAGNSLLKSLSFTSADDLMPMKVTVDLEASTTYSFQVRRGGVDDAGIYYGNSGTMTYADHGAGTGWEMSNTMLPFTMAKITTTAAGEYTYNLSYSANASSVYRLRMCVDYPIGDGDYRLIYTDATRDSGTRYKPSAIVNKVAGGKDTVSFFVRRGDSPVLKIQQATVTNEGVITWNNYSDISPSLGDLPKDSVYNICLTMDENGDISVENVVGYSGNYYIRTDAANSKWDNYRASDHMMTYSEYSEKNSTFTHYFTQYVTNGTNVKFVIANDYAPSISDTLAQQASDVTPNHVNAGGYVQADANVRFMWDIRDNAVSRTYLAAAKEDGTKFLVLRGQASELLASDGSALVGESKEYPGNNHGAGANCIQFVDDDNWIYETTVQIEPSSFVKLYAKFHGADIYYRGLDNATFDEGNAIQLVSGTGGAVQVRIIYDFKTDRIISALIPSGTITEERAINADVMFIREGQDDINQISFTGSGQLTKIKSAYGILRLNKWTLNNKDKSTHAVLGEELSVYERAMYFISFPFKVKLNEVFGFGTYGTDWVVQRYRGDLRAQQGFWAESEGFWEFIWDRRNVVLKPYEGYLLQIELGNFRESTSPFWNNGVENIELFFPSDGEMPDITSSRVTLELPAHECTINRMGEVHNGVTLGPDYDRRVTDSHWNVMSVPTYINNDDITFTNETWTTAHPNFLYEWNKNDNTLTAISGSSYEYHAMHAYIVQYAGKVTWDAKSSSPYSPIVARKTYEEAPQNVEFRIELQQNDKMVDQTFISLSNDEAVTSEFEFGYDLSKEKSSQKANIYTLIGYVPAAGNSLPLSEQTTVVPVGVQIPASGDYTFAIPDGTSGIGVTLIDTETGIRTSLSALDYTIQLSAGTYESRFLIEISPVQNTPTGIEEVPSDGVQSTKAHKMLIDNLLYIVKDGKMYDARGARVE